MRTQSRNMKGFTLIELMIVIVVVAVLVGIALPSYQQQVIKTKRAIAKGELMEVLSQQEQFFVNNRQYAVSLASLGYGNPYAIDTDGQEVVATADNRIYRIQLVGATATAFSVQAVPQLAQTGDKWCGTLTITSTGVQSETGTSTAEDCW